MEKITVYVCLMILLEKSQAVNGSDQWVPMSGNADEEFYFCTQTRNWAEARKSCADLGGQLAHPRNAQEANFITTQLGSITPSGNDTSDNWWLDGKHNDQKETLVSCGWTLPYTAWHTGEPSFSTYNTTNATFTQSCIAYSPSAPSGFKMSDEYCNETNNFICYRHAQNNLSRWDMNSGWGVNQCYNWHVRDKDMATNISIPEKSAIKTSAMLRHVSIQGTRVHVTVKGDNLVCKPEECTTIPPVSVIYEKFSKTKDGCRPVCSPSAKACHPAEASSDGTFCKFVCHCLMDSCDGVLVMLRSTNVTYAVSEIDVNAQQ